MTNAQVRSVLVISFAFFAYPGSLYLLEFLVWETIKCIPCIPPKGLSYR